MKSLSLFLAKKKSILLDYNYLQLSRKNTCSTPDSRKAFLPIYFKELGRVIAFKDLQNSKAQSPIDVTESGIVIFFNA